MKLFRIFSRYNEHLYKTTVKKASIAQTAHQIRLMQRYMRDIDLSENDRRTWGALREEVDSFKKRRLAEGVQPSTVNGSLRVLSAALHLAADDGYLSREFPRIKKLRTVQKRVSILTDDEIGELRELASRASVEARLVVDIALYTGLRRAEIEHLAIADLSESEAVLRVTEKDDDGYGKSWVPKSYAEREIPLSKPLAMSFIEYWGRTGKTPGTDGWLFTVGRNRRCRDVAKFVKPLFQAMDIDADRKPGLHMLRRTFASRLLAKGADLETCRDLMGHSSIETTMNYLGTTPKRRFDAVRVFDEE